jgi:hypothetical protein
MRVRDAPGLRGDESQKLCADFLEYFAVFRSFSLLSSWGQWLSMLVFLMVEGIS